MGFSSYVGTTDHLHSVTYREYYNKFVAVGSSGTIIESTDGMSWKSIYKNSLLFFNGISSFGNEFIIVTGNGTACISTNLIDWEVLDIENNGYIDKIISANGKLFTLVSFWRKWGLR